MEKLTEDSGIAKQVALFISQTLPVYVHLAVCEGLDKVVGREYRPELTEFERVKVTELDTYIKHHSGPDCVKVMHDRLLVFLEFCKSHDAGVTPFALGPDLSKKMTETDLQHMGYFHLQAIKRKKGAAKDAERLYTEAWNVVVQTGRTRNDAVLKYHLAKLEDTQLTRLRKQVVQHKVFKLGAVDDFCLSPQEQTTKIEAAPKKGAVEAERPKVFPPPTKVAVFPLLKFRPYHRLD